VSIFLLSFALYFAFNTYNYKKRGQLTIATVTGTPCTTKAKCFKCTNQINVTISPDEHFNFNMNSYLSYYRLVRFDLGEEIEVLYQKGSNLVMPATFLYLYAVPVTFLILGTISSLYS